jgi:hypothetical protein
MAFTYGGTLADVGAEAPLTVGILSLPELGGRHINRAADPPCVLLPAR